MVTSHLLIGLSAIAKVASVAAIELDIGNKGK